MDEAGAVPRDTPSTVATVNHASAGLASGLDGYTGPFAPIPCPGNGPKPEDPAAHMLQGPAQRPHGFAGAELASGRNPATNGSRTEDGCHSKRGV
eukprot:7892133-Karenia_brevis.AAC.1